MRPKVILPPVLTKEHNHVGTRVVLGKEMHSIYKNGYDKQWIYPSKDVQRSMGVDNVEQQIQDDVFYTVTAIDDWWDYSGGLMGDSEGESHEILYIEETPKHILDKLAAIERLQKQVNIYKQIIKDSTLKINSAPLSGVTY